MKFMCSMMKKKIKNKTFLTKDENNTKTNKLNEQIVSFRHILIDRCGIDCIPTMTKQKISQFDTPTPITHIAGLSVSLGHGMIDIYVLILKSYMEFINFLIIINLCEIITQ